MTTMLLGGLWHGANWTFIGWGALHGLYLVAQRVLGAAARRLPVAVRLPAALVRPVQVLAVFALVCVAWVFFRADSFAEAVVILERILFLGDWRFADVPGKFLLVKGLALVALLVAFELAAEQRRLRLAYGRLRWARTAGILVMLWLTPLAASFSGERFIYFQF
jgi:hypothetical protein